MIFTKKFEWDEEKERKNIVKHKVSFKQVSKVFDDENLFVSYDVRHSKSEERYNVIGMIDKLYFVVYTIRNEDTVRIISARIANKKERKIYYENILRKWS